MSKNGNAVCWWFKIETSAKDSVVTFDTDCNNIYIGYGDVKYCPFCDRKVRVY